VNIVYSTDRLDAWKARPEDIPRVVAIQNHPENRDKTWRNTEEEFLRLLDDRDTYVVAYRRKGEQETIGYGILWSQPFLRSLEFRRFALSVKSRGYGQEILKGTMRFAFETLKAHRMWLETYDFNDKAIHLYEKLGFVREGLQRDIYRDERGWLSELLYGVLEDEYAALAK